MNAIPILDPETGHNAPLWLASVLAEAEPLRFGLIDIEANSPDFGHSSLDVPAQQVRFDPATRKLER